MGVFRWSNRTLILAAGIMALLPAAGWSQATGAGLSGRVTDESGAAIVGAHVTVTRPETGFSRAAATDAAGAFRFASLPVGSYDLSVSAQRFKILEQKNLVLNIATTHTLDLTLSMAGVEEKLTVTGEVSLVRSDVSIGAIVSEQELQNLPMNGRQFANLGILAPGTSLAYNSDPTKPGQLTIALNGGIGRNVNYIVDGGDNTDDTIGGALQNFSVENVEEFKIQTQQYKAEFGRSTGGVLAVITKTGTNEFHGSAFAFGRDESLNALTTSERGGSGDKSPYSRKQWGAALGGPIKKDKVHFFGSYEHTDRDTEYVVDTGGLIASEDGKSVPIPFTDDLVGAKVTANLSPKHYLQVRFGYQKNRDKYGASPLATPDSLGTITNKYSSVLAGHTWQVGGGALNELVVQYTQFDNSIAADSKNATMYFPSGVHSGQNINTPQTTHQKKYQIKDDVAFSRTIGGKRHDFKVGLNIVHEPTLGGDFSVGVDAPSFSMKEDRVGSPVTNINRFGGVATDDTPVNQYSVYAQDDWDVTDRLTVNLGLRYDLWKGFDLDQRTSPIWQVLSTQTQYNESYLQDFQQGKGGVLENDTNNWGPRVGFTYALDRDKKRVLRGGFGIYYDFPYTNATILFPASAVQSDYGVIYNNNNPDGIRNADGSFFQPGDPLPPNGLSGLVSDPPNEVASPTLATPFTRQASLGFSTEVAKGVAVTLDLVNVDYRDLPFRFRANPATGAGQPRRFPDFGNFRLWYGKGRADYEGAHLGVHARVSDRLTLQGFYTLSKVEGNVLAGADEFRLTDVNFQPDLRNGRDVSVNPLDPLCNQCIGPLNTDARHRVTLGATYMLPWNVVAAGIFRYRSATPYTIHAGADLNGDGFVIDLPPDVAHVNTGRGSSFSQLDLRAAKTFKFGKAAGVEVLAEVFNLFNAENPALFIGNRAAANFGEATSFAGDPLQGEQRLAQLGLRLRF